MADKLDIAHDRRTQRITMDRLGELIQIVSTKGPHRVMVNADEAVPVMRAAEIGIVVDVVFIRYDGWTLGAPITLEHAARKQWDGDWIARVDVRSQSVERYGEYAPT